MKKEYRYSAQSVEEAIKKGLKELNLKEEEVKIEVEEAGNNGIFGLFKKESIVKLTPLDTDFKLSNKNEDIKNTEIIENFDNKDKSEKEELNIIERKDDVSELSKEKVVVKLNKDSDKKQKKEDYIVKNKDQIVNYLENIVKAMGYEDARVDFIDDKDRRYILNINTEENTSILIGKRGVTLNSLQYLVNNFAKRFSSHYFRLIVDCDEYRENRKKTLEELAINLAKKSKKIRKSVELEPMNSEERKIIHNALAGIKNIETESKGEEPYRYVVITSK